MLKKVLDRIVGLKVLEIRLVLMQGGSNRKKDMVVLREFKERREIFNHEFLEDENGLKCRVCGRLIESEEVFGYYISQFRIKTPPRIVWFALACKDCREKLICKVVTFRDMPLDFPHERETRKKKKQRPETRIFKLRVTQPGNLTYLFKLMNKAGLIPRLWGHQAWIKFRAGLALRLLASESKLEAFSFYEIRGVKTLIVSQNGQHEVVFVATRIGAETLQTSRLDEVVIGVRDKDGFPVPIDELAELIYRQLTRKIAIESKG